MNLIHRSIWNDQTGTFVAVSENTRSAGKRASSCTTAAGGPVRFGLNILAVSLMMACGASALAQPAGGVVSAGSATIGGTAGNMIINQTTPNVAINWQSFGIKAGESVQFVQPSTSSVALNRVTGSDPSGIFGSLSSNGKVFLVNPNGILFGQGASVNVGGLVASTLAISDANFMANNYKFSGAGTGSVVNQGTINAADGGYVALLGANVSNQGVIAAQLGTVALAAGNAVTLDMAGDKLLNVTVDQGSVNALVENGGMLRADGGQVLMTTQAAGSLLANAVNNTGVVQAQTLQNVNGTIKLLGGMENGTMNVGGTLDASAPNGGNGGFIETSAAHVKVQDNVHVTTAAVQGLTGNWLIDPPDFNIGGPNADIAGSTLGASLVANNVTIRSGDGASGTYGDINVNEAVSWTASGTATTLTLLAVRDVNINAPITATKGNLVVCCGRDVNVNALITTTGVVATANTGGNVLLAAGRDVNIVRSSNTGALPNKQLAGITTTSGNIEICAANDINLSNTFDGAALITLTGSVADSSPPTGPVTPRGMTLIAGTGGTGPGTAGGTLNITARTIIKVTGPDGISPVNIYYNPTSYLSPTNYSSFFATGDGGPFTQYMLVFPDGANKTFDGTTTATFTGLKGNPVDVALVAGSGSTANFDSAAVGQDKTVTYSGYSLAGVDAAKYAFAVSCCGPVVARTTANITAPVVVPPPVVVVPPPVVVVPPPVVVVPPVVVPPVVVPPVVVEAPVETTPIESTPVETAEGIPLPETPYEGPTVNPRVIVPVWIPVITRPATPPQLLTLAPPATPIAVPVVEKPVEKLLEQPVEAPPKPYLAPKRQPKQDRN